MVKIRKTWLIGILFIIALAGLASAKVEDVCVVVQDQSSVDVSTDTDCDDLDVNNANITTSLEKSEFNPQYGLNAANETILCSVKGLGTCADPVDLFILEKGDWKALSNKKTDLEAQGVDDDEVLAAVHGENGLISGPTPEMLKIEKITVYVDGDKEDTLDSDEILNEEEYKVKPGSEFKLKIEFENVYDDNVDIAIEDIEFDDLYIADVDDGDDLEIEKDIDPFDLDAGNKKTITAEFLIPLLVQDEEVYSVVMDMTSEDEEGVNYNLALDNLAVAIDKDPHKLIFKTVSLSKTTLECDRSTALDVEVYNVGADDEDVALTIKNTALNIDLEEEFDLEEASDEDAVYDNSFNIDLGEAVKAGIYKIAVQAKYGSKSITENVDLTVKDCVVTPPLPELECTTDNDCKGGEVCVSNKCEEEVEVITPPGEGEAEGEGEGAPPITGEVILEEKTWIEQNQYAVVLILAIIVIILLIIWVVTAMRK